MKASDFFDLPPSLAPFAGFFRPEANAWEWVSLIAAALAAQDAPRAGAARVPAGVQVEGPVHFGSGVTFPASATIIGPAWIGPGTQIRPGAFIRGGVITGADCVLGHACEFKNCLLLDRVQVPHFSYVGDSVLGNGAHLGAGAICSNLRLDQQVIFITTAQGPVNTGMRKLGAILGDAAEVGCNAVLNPGTLLGKRSLVMPAIAFGGVLPAGTIARVRQPLTLVPRKF